MTACNRFRRHLLPLTALVALAPLITTGCSGPVASQSAADRRAEVSTERQQLDMIPPPSKSRYMSIHSFEGWENPYLTVQPNMVTLHVLIADANSTPYGVGGMLRPIGARRQELNISMDKLGEAMSSIPQSAWPYGRVVAVEEAHNTPPKGEPVVRRNMELTVSRLNDLGLAAYDISDGTLR